MQRYETGSILIKAIAEPIRLQILDILSNGEMCACDILQNLQISQPTLSHHMKALTASGWIVARRQATWMYYSININSVEKMHRYLLNLTTNNAAPSTQVARGNCVCCEENESGDDHDEA